MLFLADTWIILPLNQVTFSFFFFFSVRLTTILVFKINEVNDNTHYSISWKVFKLHLKCFLKGLMSTIPQEIV